MRKNLFLSAALLLIISIIVVSCAPAEVQTEDTSNTIQVYFGNLEAKAIDDTAYTVTGSATFDGSTVKIGDVDDYYWSYKATKKDSLFNQGQTDGFVNCAEGTGLGTARTFSKGKWLFELRAYATAADRTAGTQYLFSGTNESITTNNSDTVLSSNTTISIPVQYSYIAGTGIADFAITTTLTQDKEEAGSDIKTYTVTGVTASIGGKDYELESTDNETWELTTPQEVPSGVQAVGLKVYVDSTEVSQASNASVGNAIILHGLTTEIKGTATITLTGSTIGLSFNPSMPSEQPTEDGFETEVSVNNFAAFKEAATKGKNIKLLADIVLTEDVTLGTRGVIIDLAGKKISGVEEKVSQRYVCALNDIPYTSLDGALKVADEGETIALMVNVTVTTPYDFGSVIVDFNGFSISSSNSAKLIF